MSTVVLAATIYEKPKLLAKANKQALPKLRTSCSTSGTFTKFKVLAQVYGVAVVMVIVATVSERKRKKKKYEEIKTLVMPLHVRPFLCY